MNCTRHNSLRGKRTRVRADWPMQALRPALRFTLIEMLVVISIIGVLAALLMPALQRSIASARALSCVNNLKQLGIGVFAYSESFNGVFATIDANTGLSWQLPYIAGPSYGYSGSGIIEGGNLWYCPATQRRGGDYIYGGMKPYGGGLSTVSTTMSSAGYSGVFYSLRLNGFRTPSSVAIAGDAAMWWGSYTGPYRRLYKDAVGFTHAGESSGMLCADGHAVQANPSHLKNQTVVAADFLYPGNSGRVPFAAGYDAETGQRLF